MPDVTLTVTLTRVPGGLSRPVELDYHEPTRGLPVAVNHLLTAS
ncbi:hypothetical protein JD79_04381 [Geodermatophilus normandii]|uniref:Uncharacterized protein n=1 Tax=Geodermatophilus normandii TaxID=1137989 RepID=A0A317QQ76_9ACTN|nr:hypothetical protein [Geodermatophilus normandii]PWW25183.1 hypothetical protein JD79_04381 [Geodermatophilus normandii]